MQIIPNLYAGEGKTLSDKGEAQKQFFKCVRCSGLRNIRCSGTDLSPAKDMIKSAFTTVTEAEGRLAFPKAGCPSASHGECLEKLWIPGPCSRATNIIIWFYSEETEGQRD